MRNRQHRITIQSLVTSQDSTTGNIVESWEVFGVVWASFRPSSVREFVAAGIAQSKITAAFEIDYLAGIKPSMRILHGAGVWNIEGVLPDFESGIEYITLPVSEITSG